MDKATALERINEIIGTVEGVIGVAARTLEGNAEIMVNATQVFPTASTIKVPVLYELYRQAEMGLVDLKQRIPLKAEHRVNGSGVLQDLDFDLNVTVRDLAVLMTVVSDNTATDMLFELVGRDKVYQTMQELGLEQTNVAITLREMMYLLAGYDINDPSKTYEVVRQRLTSARSEDKGRATAETDNDVSSPLDMVQLLTLIAKAQTLSRASCDDMIEIMARQKFNEIIPLYLPYGTRVAHKTGWIVTVRADVGIVYAPEHPYTVALMAKQVVDEIETPRKMADTKQNLSGPTFEPLAEKVLEAMERLKVPGVAVGLYYQGQEYSVGFGVTNINHPLPVDNDTLFQIGSTTKTFTATAAMRLVEEGKLDLDRPLIEYLPQFKLGDENATRNATMRHLLTHTGGWVGDYFEDFGMGEDAVGQYVTHMADLEQLTPLGELWSYNNAGFSLAGLVIQTIAGKPYETVIKEMIFEPLGLKHSFFFAGDAIVHRVAVGHFVTEKETKIAEPWPLARSAHAAGAIISSAKDQLRYARFQMGDGTNGEGTRLLKPETLALMQTPQVTLSGHADGMGISWFIKDLGGVKTVFHGGTTNGQLSAFLMAPEQDFAITVLTNANVGGILHGEIAKWALEHYLKAIKPEPELIELEKEKLATFVGRYRFALSDVEIKLEGEHLILQAIPKGGFPDKSTPPPPTPPPTRLAFFSSNRALMLDFPFKGQEIEFITGPDGQVAWLRYGLRIGAPQMGEKAA